MKRKADVESELPRQDVKKRAETKEELEELRQRLKKRKELLKEIPKLDLKSYGQEAALDVEERNPLRLRAFQGFLLYALMGAQAPIDPSFWCKFQRWNKVTRTNCLILEGLCLKDFINSDEQFKSLFEHKLEFNSPYRRNSTFIEDISILPVSGVKMRQLNKDHKSISKAVTKGQVFKVKESILNYQSDSKSSKLKLMLSVDQMVNESYPLLIEGPMSKKYVNFVQSKDEYEPVTDQSPMFAVDCEMCLTSIGKLELTKVCVVDSELKEVYQTFVKPRNPITNYLTRFSGITAQLLQDVETRLDDVQKALKELLPADAIWVGQSLSGDLNALQMIHPYVIDTSVIFNITGIPGRKTKLKKLSEMFLGETIQNKGADGHDPKEDAIAAMKLVLLKLEKGLQFGDAVSDENFLTKSEDKTVISTSFFKEAHEKNKKVSVMTTSDLLDDYKKYGADYAKLIESKKQKDVIEKCCDSLKDNDLNICHVDTSQMNGDKKMYRIRKLVKKMWCNTDSNGIFATVWPGSVTENAFVGIALKKANME